MYRIRNIVVPVDFSELSQAAIDRAVTLSQLDGASVHLVHAVRTSPMGNPVELPIPAALWDSVREASRQKVAEAREAIEGKGPSSVTADVVDSGDVASVIDVVVFIVTTCTIAVVVIICITLEKFGERQTKALANVIDNRRILACIFAPAVVDVIFHSGSATSAEYGNDQAQDNLARARRQIAAFPSCLVEPDHYPNVRLEGNIYIVVYSLLCGFPFCPLIYVLLILFSRHCAIGR